MRQARTVDSESRLAQIQHQFGRVILWLRPDGLQTRARRNAWAAMVADRQRRQDRTLVDREQRLAGHALTAPVLRAQAH